jgi:hypothetical protein
MRTFRVCQVLAVAITLSSSAVAQTPPDAAASQPVPVRLTPAAPPVLPAAPPAPGSCMLGSHEGIADADATTAWQLVCDDLRRRAPDTQDSFTVELRRLGNVRLLVLARTNSAGQFVEQRQLQIGEMEEALQAAPRLVESMLAHSSVDSTVRVDNVVQEEARASRTHSGTNHFVLGLGGVVFPGGSGLVSPAIELGFYHESKRFALGGDFRGGYRSARSSVNDSEEASMYAMSVGGRIFLMDTDTTPMVGFGLSWVGLSVHSNKGDASESGAGAYVEAGVEALRTHHTRLLFSARATLPFYSMNEVKWSYPAAPAGSTQSSGPQETSSGKYVVPVAINATIAF